MPRTLHVALAFTSALLLGTWLGAAPRTAQADVATLGPGAGQIATPVSEPPPPPHDPKKKKEGEACKSSSECQVHHTCTKVGDSSVCKAPPPRQLPPGAVT